MSVRRQVDFDLWITSPVMSNNSTLQAQYSDNTIINGRMPYNCSLVVDGTPCSSHRTYTKFRVRPGKRYRLRLINSGSGGIQYFSIDGHNLTIVSNDFVDIHPYNTTIVTLGVRLLPPVKVRCLYGHKPTIFADWPKIRRFIYS